jgi:hypothetical protein
MTRREQDEIREEKKRLTAEEVDRNAYREPTVRTYAPFEIRKRRPGWVSHRFILPKQLLKGLKVLAKIKAQELATQRSQEPYGFRRRRPRTISSFVAEAINRLLVENGLSEFCVED